MKNRLLDLRNSLKAQGLSAFVIPHSDEHQSEYTPDYAGRLEWMTGFNGSAGEAVVSLEAAAIFVDGRYTLQVRDQVDGDDFTYLKLYENKVEDWLVTQIKSGDRVGYDPWLTTVGWIEGAAVKLKSVGAELVELKTNPIDGIWQDQPSASLALAAVQPVKYAGETHDSKIKRIGESLTELGADAAVLTSLDSICWLLNIRGMDVDSTPLLLSFAIIQADGAVKFFVDSRKLTDEVRNHLGSNVEYFEKTQFAETLAQVGAEFAANGKSILVDVAKSPAAVYNILSDAKTQIIKGDDPTILPKACKNPTELQGTREAHIRDAVAVCRFLKFIEEEAPKGTVTELSAVDKLFSFRQEVDLFQMNSFDTISGSGSNGAIVHYRVSAETSKKLENNSVYLVDSGGQYFDGTTDITRTVIIGAASDEQKDRFTRVLKGHIALAQVKFPKGRSGGHLDALARRPLWDIGLDYDHGTGHGVGSYLGVHEGPQGISPANVKHPLCEGMILSNEPGYYKSGEYGIRIENLIIVIKSLEKGEGRDMLAFETITFVPIDKNLIDLTLMDVSEINWLNDYHAKVRSLMETRLTGADLQWMMKATDPLQKAAS